MVRRGHHVSLQLLSLLRVMYISPSQKRRGENCEATNKGTAGSMGVSAGEGLAARAGSASAAGTAEVDEPSVAWIEAAIGASRACADLSSRLGQLWVQIHQSWRSVAQPSRAMLNLKIQDRVKETPQNQSVGRRHAIN